jgi:hypothetical protein
MGPCFAHENQAPPRWGQPETKTSCSWSEGPNRRNAVNWCNFCGDQLMWSSMILDDLRRITDFWVKAIIFHSPESCGHQRGWFPLLTMNPIIYWSQNGWISVVEKVSFLSGRQQWTADSSPILPSCSIHSSGNPPCHSPCHAVDVTWIPWDLGTKDTPMSQVQKIKVIQSMMIVNVTWLTTAA